MKRRCEEDGGARGECMVTFASIEDAVRRVGDSVQSLHTEVREVREQGIRMAESQASLWHELRDNVKPAIQDLAGSLASAVRTHATDCPARTRAMAAASAPAPHPADPPGDPGAAVRLAVPRWVWYLGVIIGTAIATALLTMFAGGAPAGKPIPNHAPSAQTAPP